MLKKLFKILDLIFIIKLRTYPWTRLNKEEKLIIIFFHLFLEVLE